MPLSVSTTPYCSSAELVAMGLEDNPVGSLDALIQDASRIIDHYCWQTFDPEDEITVKVSDVRKLLVSLPRPFKDVTAVTVNGMAIGAESYIVEDWGLRLYSIEPLQGGWPVRGAGSGGTWPYQASGAPYGSQVEVTATFGWEEIPTMVARACRVLCLQMSEPGDPIVPGVTKYQVGGYDIEFNRNDPHPMVSTGSVEADRLLQAYRRDEVLVA